MTEDGLFSHYERVYYYEAGRKEQIFSRLNIPLAVMVAVVGAYAVIVGPDYKVLSTGLSIWFWVLISLSIVALIIGAVFFIDALLGRMDQAPATPNDLESWRQELLEYYSNESDCGDIVSRKVYEAVYADFMNCASILTLNNDRKASSLFFCNLAVIFAVAFAALAYAVLKFSTL